MNYQMAFKDFQSWLQDTASWFSTTASAMDIQLALICGGVFFFSAVVVYLISVFGMRERTYEEAMEEQRKRNQETILHSKSDKSKKEKKFRKWGKKGKDKSEEERVQLVDSDIKAGSEDAKADADANSSSSQTMEQKGMSVKKKIRQRKAGVTEKDDCSRPISSSDDTDDLPSLSCSPVTKQPTKDDYKFLDKSLEIKDNFKSSFQEELISGFKDVIEVTDHVKPARKSPVKRNKKSKPEHLELSADFRDSNENKILNIIKTTLLTEEEVQHILDVLGAKQKMNDKKKSEITALKKIIQEKEEALKNEQKVSQSANERITELLQEACDMKAEATATEKSLRDAVNQEQQEIKALHGMMQRKREQYTSEISALQSKMQHMKNKMKEEHALTLQHLQDENSQLQSLNRIEVEKHQRSSIELSRLQHEVEQLRSARDKFDTHQAAMQQGQEDLHMQVQQLEKHIEQLLSSHQEEEYGYKQRMGEMSSKMQQMENGRSSLLQELQNTKSVCSGLEAENGSLRQRLDDAKHQLKSSEQDLLQLQSRLEESNRQQRDLANCLDKMRSEVMDLSTFKRDQLQVIQTLRQENEVLASKVNQQMSETSEQKQQNGDVSDKTRLVEIQEHESTLQEKESTIHRLSQELEQCRCEIISLSSELENQKKKSKELSEKNSELSKLVESSEKKLREEVKSAEIKVQEAQSKMDSSSKEMQNLLNEQIKGVESNLKEKYAKEVQDARKEAEDAKKEAEENLLKCETEANVRLEEFQESMYGRLSEIATEAEKRINEAVQEKEQLRTELDNMNLSVKKLLRQAFPDLKTPEKLDNKESWSQFETAVNSYMSDLRSGVNYESKDVENLLKKLVTASSEKADLESQVKTYQAVLAETESMLKTLQSNIENEEKRWQLELQGKDDSMKKVVCENENLQLENKNLKASLDKLNNLKDTLYEIEELRVKLHQEESENKRLLEKIGNIHDSTAKMATEALPESIMEFSEDNASKK